jgi:glyoxylase-like metal-dependent hydrolase (beta-lactamase superfamily II)
MMATGPQAGGPISQVRIQLTEAIPLYVPLVKGADYAVWIDSGIQSLFPQLEAAMAAAGVRPGDLRFILHTHSHHDHIGCNAQLRAKTGCLIAAHPRYAAWHVDFERHYQEFARPFPDLVADTPALREEVLGILDRPQPLDLFVDEGVQFNLGGGVSLRALAFPGHMLAELGWLEASTRTLILGDAVTGLDWPIFHSHLSVSAYRHTLARLADNLGELRIERVLFAHFPPMRPPEVRSLLERAAAYLDEIEVTLLRLLAGQPSISLQDLWMGTCQRLGRQAEFRALNMVQAHVQDLTDRQVIREVAPMTYALR